VVAGHACLDLTPAWNAEPAIDPGRLIGVGPLGMSPGGCVGNTGLALVALGVPTQLVADVGSDRLGRLLVDLLASSGADITGISGVDGMATSYSIVVDFASRDRTFWHHMGANAAFTGAGVIERIEAALATNSGAPAGVGSGAGRGAGPGAGRGAGPDGVAGPGAVGAPEVILHVGYPTLLPALHADGGAALTSLVEAARARGALVSLDMAAVDPGSDAGGVDWEGHLTRTLRAVDIVKASVDDLSAMMPGRDGLSPDEWAVLLVDLGAAAGLVTAGADGLFLRTGPERRTRTAAPSLRAAAGEWSNRQIWVPTLAARVLVTTAAGDVAAAGFLAGLSAGQGPAECALLAGASAAARISGRPIVDAYRIAAEFSPESAARPNQPLGWTVGPDRVYHGPHDMEA
jgi:sugar/nucleoside kinase (ribokinase family)